MNDRERFRRLMRGERVDRPPLLEEGVRDDQLPRGIGGPSARPRGLSSAVSGPCGASASSLRRSLKAANDLSPL